MKKAGTTKMWGVLALVTVLAGSAALTGCGKKNAEETTLAEETTAAGTAAELATAGITAIETITEAETEAEISTEGMVKSFLTGEWVDESIGTKRPLAIMISNVKAAVPGSGLNTAGVIYETPMEGGEVRLEILTENYETLERIGSIRSARTYHPWIAAEFDAIYVHYGRSDYVISDLNSGNIDDIDGVTSRGTSAFYRTTDRVAPHNAYTTPELLDAKIESLGFEREYDDDYEGKFTFAEDDSPVTLTDGQEAAKVTIGYLVNQPWFEYNEEDQLYYRYQYGEAQIDELDGEQVTCTNIIVQYCSYTMQDDDYTKNIYTVGEGTGVYITGGRAETISWSKADKWSNTIFTDENGEEITLNQGRTWVCIVLPSMTGEITLE
ncbi:MAG: DUF3048 domain-containing protein [Lachnospiraceae bacterium]|nr:DUF3048 domain-containing protein [Lachnospiraceae bacterium]